MQQSPPSKLQDSVFRESWQIPSPFMSNNLEEQFVGNSIVKLPQNSEKIYKQFYEGYCKFGQKSP